MRYRSELEVDFRVLKENFDLLRELTPSNKVVFMVKANAYGHGLLECSKFASEELDVDSLGVASLGEAVHLRKSLPSMNTDILVLSDTGMMFNHVRELYLDYNISPVLSSIEDLKDFLEDKRFQHAPLLLKVDTGMNRLGILPTEVDKACSLMKAHGRRSIEHLMTHFACSYKKFREGDKTDKQNKLFQKIKKQIRDESISINKTSCANSGAIEQGIGLGESHIRPGLMLYGPGISMDKNGWTGKNVSSLKTYVIKCVSIKKGTPIGYGGHVCHADGFIVYLPIGYGDGLLSYYSKSEIEIEGEVGKVMGRVNMDMAAIWFPKDAKTSFKRGQIVRIWDHDRFSVTRLAMAAKTVPYQVFTAINPRVPRSYIV
ncbi:MAG: alanine racemase [Halobacteriovoraceae bacterium]|nr:alanine racemase [Halobacteriovoraceae bacterium]|tara:strand:+ start:332092 stop:333210 length:1119 start_codon:yes stop_codon:yes gene_type:complete